MTDKDIIKVLECCKSRECSECKRLHNALSEERECRLDLMEKVYSLIERQQAEIERFEEDKQTLWEEVTKAYERGKVKAYNELAEELKRHCSDIDSDNINEPTVRILWDAEDTIDEVLKELVGEH